MRLAWLIHAVVSIALLATTVVTARRAERMTGEPRWLVTRTHVLVEEPVEADNPTDAALDALFEEAGEPATMLVRRPLFILGLLDATVPVMIGGAVVLLAAGRLARRRRRRSAVRPGPGPDQGDAGLGQ